MTTLPSARSLSNQDSTKAFTLPEIMVAMAVFGLVITGFLGVHICGLKMNELVRLKLGASDDARRALSRFVDDVRTAGLVRVGQGNVSSFSGVQPGQPQTGNAIEIRPEKTVTNRFIRYFLDPNDAQLKRVDSEQDLVIVLANSVTNQSVFSAEDHAGNILTNHFNNRVIGLTLQFSQIASPAISVGEGHHYDFYQLRTKITRRALE
jgi:prepilin-type N-terminal cleavage/methylation domain-containing protein